VRLGANQPRIGTFNERVVINALRRGSALSQTELAEVTGLAIPTVAGIVKQLAARGMVRVAGTRPVRQGRPRTLLALEPEARFALGIHLDPTQVSITLLDLAGNARSTQMEVGALAGDPTEVVDRIAAMCAQVIDASGAEPARVVGAGLASPGPIDLVEGVLVDPPWLPGWTGFPVRDALSASLKMDVLFEKDTLAAVTGETWLRIDDDSDRTVMFVYLGMGIGLGFSAGGEAFRGSSGNAGEIGNLFRAPWMDGEVGSGATAAADSAAADGAGVSRVDPAHMVRVALDRGILGHGGSRIDTSGGPLTNLAALDAAFADLCTQALSGNEGAQDILREAGAQVGSAVALLSDILDVDEVVCGGPYWERVRPWYLDPITRAVAAPRAGGVPHTTSVSSSVMGASAGAIGAAAMVLDERSVPRASMLAARG
jgi:predicted NBD/HSP70 family sugar kinase